MTTQTFPTVNLSAAEIPQKNIWEIEDLDNPALFLNREFTWLNFNERVLSMAADKNLPLLERVKFLAIVGSNLDEFFMKRIGGLYQQVYAGIEALSIDGLSPEEQIRIATNYVQQIQDEQRRVYLEVRGELADERIYIRQYDELTEAQKTFARDYFYDNVYPLVTPQSTDPAHPFPFVSNLSLNLLVSVRRPGSDNTVITRIKIPLTKGVKRFVNVSNLEVNHHTPEFVFVTLEEIIRNNLDILLPGMEILDSTLFRITRNAITETSEEQADDLLELIESELRERRFAPIVRLQLEATVSEAHKALLVKFLGVDPKQDVFTMTELFGTRNLMELMGIPKPALKDAKHAPMDHPLLANESNIFQAIRQHGAILLHHPYDAFSSSVERLLKEASRDERVQAIKMTLYRTSDDSKIIKHLIDAAQNGKQVTVVMEIKATFDESANIRWAQRLERSGIHVTYGIVGLKTHCKIIHVVRQEKGELVRYGHIGTGNYHSDTARLYTDMGVLTCDSEIGADLTELFNYLTTGFTPKRSYQRISPAPKHLKPDIMRLILQAADATKNGEKASITLKTNALEDKDITRALYLASAAGVKIRLLVRDTCRLRPGLKNISENIEVRSVVGRFLEHSRIYHFDIKGETTIYIGSADLMKRNLESRVEVMLSIEEAALKARLTEILQHYWKDNVGAWQMLSDGSYQKIEPNGNQPSYSIQQNLIDAHEEAYKDSQRLSKRRTQSLAWLPKE